MGTQFALLIIVKHAGRKIKITYKTRNTILRFEHLHFERKSLVIAGIVAAIVIIGGTFAYSRYFGIRTVIRTNLDKDICREGNIFDRVDRQARFTALSGCEAAIEIVHDIKGARQKHGDYQFNLDIEQPYKKLLNDGNDKQVNGRHMAYK